MAAGKPITTPNDHCRVAEGCGGRILRAGPCLALLSPLLHAQGQFIGVETSVSRAYRRQWTTFRSGRNLPAVHGCGGWLRGMTISELKVYDSRSLFDLEYRIFETNPTFQMEPPGFRLCKESCEVGQIVLLRIHVCIHPSPRGFLSASAMKPDDCRAAQCDLNRPSL